MDYNGFANFLLSSPNYEVTHNNFWHLQILKAGTCVPGIQKNGQKFMVTLSLSCEQAEWSGKTLGGNPKWAFLISLRSVKARILVYARQKSSKLIGHSV